MKILIILTRFNASPYEYDPDSTEINYRYLMPMGLGYISSVLKLYGHKVDILNLNHIKGKIQDIIHEKMKDDNYDFMFTGGVSIYYPNVKDVVKYVRESSPKTKIVLGGGLISAQPGIMLTILKPDYIIIGEGEITATELIDCIELGKNIETVKGIGYLVNGEIYINAPQKPIEDLDNLPLPDFESFGYLEFLEHINPNYISYDYFDKPRVYPILASRSCPFGCTFCFHTIGNKYRQRSVKSIMDEIKYAVPKYHINVLFFYDELFAYDRDRAIDFCNQMKEYLKTVPWELRMNLNLRVDCADEEIIKLLSEIGCNPIGLGLESFSPVVLKSMKKHTKPEQIVETLKLIKKYGLVPQGAFIFGDVAETFETAQETIDFYKNNQDILRGGVSIGFIIPFQGSPIYKHCVANGKIKSEGKFIADRAKYGYDFYNPMNLTDSLSDKEFKKLVGKVFTMMTTTQYYSIPTKSEMVNGINEITINCPYCRKSTTYQNFIYPGILDFTNIGCRHCNGRYMMVAKTYPVIKILIKSFGFKNLYNLKQFAWIFINAGSRIKHTIFK